MQTSDVWVYVFSRGKCPQLYKTSNKIRLTKVSLAFSLTNTGLHCTTKECNSGGKTCGEGRAQGWLKRRRNGLKQMEMSAWPEEDQGPGSADIKWPMDPKRAAEMLTRFCWPHIGDFQVSPEGKHHLQRLVWELCHSSYFPVLLPCQGFVVNTSLYLSSVNISVHFSKG